MKTIHGAMVVGWLTLGLFVIGSAHSPSKVVAQETADGLEKLPNDDSSVPVVASAWKLMKIDSDASLRGLHVLDNHHVWASGTGGTVINTTDAGTTWNVQTIKGAEKLDFRDIHAIDTDTVVAMTSGTPARIYRTTDGGSTWKLCFENKDERVFMDAMSFWDDKNGVIMGDPIDNLLFLLRTTDGGKTWEQDSKPPRTLAGEAGFAASGTNAVANGKQAFFVGLGGAEENKSYKTSRILASPDRGSHWTAVTAPFERTPSAGVFSIAFADEKTGVAVGGDYQNAESKENNFAITSDGGQSWVTPKDRFPPSGYRSGVAVARNGQTIQFVTVGPSGTDVSTDLGRKWRRISNQGFHAVAFAPDGITGWASGSKGRIARWNNHFDREVK